MSIPYTLVPNKLTDKGGYLARMKSVGTADLEIIADHIVERGSTVGKADVLAVLHLLIEVCISLVLQGWRINLGGLVRFYCSIEGVFTELNQPFNHQHHTLKGVAQTGIQLNKALENQGQVRRQETRLPRPEPQQFTDLSSQMNDRLTPGGTGQLMGARLKLNPNADDEGVFLIAQADGQLYRLEILYNAHNLLLFNLPHIPPGAYYLEVHSRVGNAADVRTSRLSQQLDAA